MGYIPSYKVHDSLRDRDCRSIKEAWPQYAPEISYVTFRDRLKAGAYPHLSYSPSNVNMLNIVRTKQVRDLQSGETWESMTACARDLEVTFQAVQLALKRKGTCRGHLLEWAED